MPDSGHAIRTRVGRALLRFRLQRHLSQDKLAELADSSGKHVGQIERGDVSATLDVLGRLADALSVDAADLFPRPRGRQSSKTALLVITRDEVDQIIDIGERVKALRAPRSKRASR
jgi:transcriptional regulator with XRE-family HTH domain